MCYGLRIQGSGSVNKNYGCGVDPYSSTLLSISYSSYQVGHFLNVFPSAQYPFREREGCLFLKLEIVEKLFIMSYKLFPDKIKQVKGSV